MDSMERSINELNESIGRTWKSVDKRIDGLEAEIDANAETVSKKLAAMRSDARPGLAWGPSTSFAEFLGEGKDRQIAKATMTGDHPALRKHHEALGLGPDYTAAKADWWSLSLRSQLRGGLSLSELERKEKLEHAFESAAMSRGIHKVALAEGTGVSGGNLVPTIIYADVLRIVQDSSVVFGRATHLPMESLTMQIPNEATGATVNFVAEAGTMTGGEPTFGVNTLTAKKLVGRATASLELVQDSVLALMPYIQTIMAEKVARTLDGEALEGSGTNFTGVENASGVLTTGNPSPGLAPTYNDLVRIMFKAGEASTRSTAAWFMNPQIFGNVVALIDSNGQPIVQFGAISSTPIPTLLGRPVYLSNVLEVNVTTGVTGSTGQIYFGDPMKLIFGDRMAMQFDVTDQVNWATGQFDMRLIGRWGFTVATPAAWCVGVGFKKLGT